MVRKCGGLPLAICALGGILATKRADIKEWKYIHRDVASNINRGKDGGVMGILALSYNDLPVHLKPCFLYLGLFPEDYAIPRRKLIQLWIAKGFIPHTKEDAQGTLGKHEYYAELIQRCMIQPDKYATSLSVKRTWRDKTCRMHDLMRDLCLSKGKELNFLDIYNHGIDGTTSSNDTSRRLRRYAINLTDEPRFGLDFHFNNSASALRTLRGPSFRRAAEPLMKYQHMKLLRVLDLGDLYLQKNELKMVFELIHLRYLGIGGLLRQDKIPSSIGNLRNLETLKLEGDTFLPETITKLVQLRHLEMKVLEGKISHNFRIENLMNLQTLSDIRAGKWIRKGCFGKLSKLQNLSVYHTSRSQADVLIHEITNKKSSSSSSFDDQHQNPIRVLELRLTGYFDNKIFDLLSCCNNLHRIRLDGRLDGGLNLQKYPPNLSKLILKNSSLEKDPMETLQYLPNLNFLQLAWAFQREEMVCSTKGFPQLQILNIEWMRQLKKWTIDQGGMPCLKELNLEGLEKLSMLPEGLRFITTLKKLTIYGMPTIRKRIVREVGEDWYKVQHIPSLIVREYD
ncbi:disease resistance protein RPP8-like [Papaver somniferum]|uniref:disease resistance protein RPP8-like n=1 Tax=Papaver somniferum TaxID=3469 RepID=UPI000E6FEAEB|nr:disease resistance protein RPP8-like [Papaver somniferum]